MLAALLGVYAEDGILHFLQYAILFDVLNKLKASFAIVSWMFRLNALAKCFFFHLNHGHQAGLPPRFFVGRKSTVNDLCSRLYTASSQSVRTLLEIPLQALHFSDLLTCYPF